MTKKTWAGALPAFAFVAALLPLSAIPALAGSGPAVFINELHYDNSGSDSNEAVEIAGPAGTDLNGWSLVFYNGSGGVSYDTISLSGTLPDQQSGYAVLVFAATGLQNGAPDGLALVNAANNVVQFLSYEGSFTAADGPAVGMTSVDIGVAEGSSTLVGDSLQLQGTGTTYDDFTWTGPTPNTFGSVNTDQTFGTGPSNAGVAVTCGGTLFSTETLVATRTIEASDADGTVTNIAITSTPVEGITLSDLVPASSPGGMATAAVTVDPHTAPGSYAIEVTASNDDAAPQTGTCSFQVTVDPITPIGTVQGRVTDANDGLTFVSPYVGEYVTIKAVVTQRILSRTSLGYNSWGYFLQNTAATADDDPDSSDGIFLYTGSYDDITNPAGGYFTPQVGDELIIRARVSEYYNLTELGSASLKAVVRTGVDLDSEVSAFTADPPNNLDDANRYWERHEGMRAQIPANSTALSGRDVFASTLDAEVWLAAPDSPISGLSDYEARAFRDGRNLDDFEGNGFRVVLGSLGLKAAADDNTAMIAPVRTFDTITSSPIGGVYFSFGKYQIQIGEQLTYTDGVDPSDNYPPQSPELASQSSITTFNMENLYDYRDDPFDGCDFTGNAGCDGVSPPFDYVPGSADDYAARLTEIAEQILRDLNAPDIVLAQEIEDQDICSIEKWELVCGDADNADGKPDALEDLAIAIHGLGGPSYDSAFDRDGADDRGITAAFLFRADRVELLPASADNPALGDNPTVSYPGGLSYNYEVSNPKALNAVLPSWVDTSTGVDGDNVFTRAPQVGYFRIWQDGIGMSAFTDLYAISNHFSSGPDARVGQRTEQATYDAAIVAAFQADDPNVRVLVGGDLNVYPDSDQLVALYDQGLTNLYYSLLDEHPFSAYSYVFQGQAQTLDQLYVAPSMFDDLVEIRAAHINSDFPADYVGDDPRGTSDHDPQVALFHIGIAQVEALVQYFADEGKITGRWTAQTLLKRLERARKFHEAGRTAAFKAQLIGFILQVKAFTPRFIDRDASYALTQTASLVASFRRGF